jgi:hypothetical protein
LQLFASVFLALSAMGDTWPEALSGMSAVASRRFGSTDHLISNSSLQGSKSSIASLMSPVRDPEWQLHIPRKEYTTIVLTHL